MKNIEVYALVNTNTIYYISNDPIFADRMLVRKFVNGKNVTPSGGRFLPVENVRKMWNALITKHGFEACFKF